MTSRGYQKLLGDDVEYTSGLKPQVQKVGRNRPYEFSDDGPSSEIVALTSRSQSTYKSTGVIGNDVELVEIQLLPNDSLRSLSIKFMCPISELKRVNNIETDNQAYALNTLKIPVRSHQHHLIEEVKRYAAQGTSSDSQKEANACSTDGSDDECEEMHEESRGEDVNEHFEGEDSMTSTPLLARTYHEGRRAQAKTGKKKFEKMMEKNKELIEGMKPIIDRTESLDELTLELNSHRTTVRSRAKCEYMQASPMCVLVSFVVLLIVVPIVFFILYEKGHLSWVISP